MPSSSNSPVIEDDILRLLNYSVSSEFGVRSSEFGVRSSEFGVRSSEFGVCPTGTLRERSSD